LRPPRLKRIVRIVAWKIGNLSGKSEFFSTGIENSCDRNHDPSQTPNQIDAVVFPTRCSPHILLLTSHSFIHYMNLYCASSRLLLTRASDSSTAKKSNFKARFYQIRTFYCLLIIYKILHHLTFALIIAIDSF